MHIYYVAGLPYSDELYHSGVKGMKWYQRRYQNPDGSLTPLGRIHYGVGNAAKKTAKAIATPIKKVASHEMDKFKRKHPWTMSNEEIVQMQKRMELEKSFNEAKKRLNDTKFSGRAKKTVGDMLKTFGDTAIKEVTKSASSELARRFLETKDAREARHLKEEADKYNRMIERDKAKEGYESRKNQSKNNTQGTKEEKKSDTYGTAKKVNKPYGPPDYFIATESWKKKKNHALFPEKEVRRLLYGIGGTAYK